MASTKVQFQNKEGQLLAARLELPTNQHPHAYAVFAHCFTCSKNLSAVRNISRSLNQAGMAILRFDFTGLGESEGDFEDTNFSSNVEDLVAACEYVRINHQAPSLLIGHSLGGAAVVCAASELSYVKAVATIAAPYAPKHVSHLIQSKMDDINTEGIAEVNIGGRPFTIKKQFLEDIVEQSLQDKLEHLDKSLLILHSPQDQTVAIENAAKMYHAAKHPKSFISLDGADHLLSNKEDSLYVGEQIASWAKRYLERSEAIPLRAERQVAVRLGQEGFTTEVMVRQHSLTADEPPKVGGNDFGPTPYELLTAGLGACTAMTMQMYARRKKWDLQEVIVQLDHNKDYAADCENCDDPKSKIDHFDRYIEMKGNLDEQQRVRLLEIADKCPVHRTLHSEIQVNTTEIKA